MSENILVGYGGILNEFNNYFFLQDSDQKDSDLQKTREF